MLKEIKGKFAYGFDLDNKPDSPISFTDPDTGEKGIKNQLLSRAGLRAQLPRAAAGPSDSWRRRSGTCCATRCRHG